MASVTGSRKREARRPKARPDAADAEALLSPGTADAPLGPGTADDTAAPVTATSVTDTSATDLRRAERAPPTRAAETSPEEAASDDPSHDAPPPGEPHRPRRSLVNGLKRAGRGIVWAGFGSVTRRIVTLNLAGLVALLTGMLYLNQFRAGLIDARVQSLLIQGEIVAAAVAASAAVETDAITIDPDRLLELQAGETLSSPDESVLEFPINPERVGPVLRRLVGPTKTRARIYDREGSLVLDSTALYARGEILQYDLAAPDAPGPGIVTLIAEKLRGWLGRVDLPKYRELGTANGRGYQEVAIALNGQAAHQVRVNDRGEIIVSVAVPVQRFRGVLGALMLSTQGGDIDDVIAAERLAILRVFLVAAAVMVLLSILLASTIAGPMRKLADAADRVRHRVKAREEIPDFSHRGDEIGHLSSALRDMTSALYRRIEAIERFAADVSHELKNPLTSLRSAVETLPLAKTDQSRGRLLEVIQHDVKRLDRLISDISDASRLDAELQRNEAEPVDLRRLLSTVVKVADEVRRDNDVAVKLKIDPPATRPLTVRGNDSRLGQVVNNLIDNARSFSPEKGEVRVTCRIIKDEIEIAVDDDGPGINEDALDRIFERFYTDRPHQGFGQNSGLGLSISKQIVEAHGGRIWAENRIFRAKDGTETVRGARFTVRLPIPA